MSVRDAVLADAPALARIQVESWRAAYAGLVEPSVLDALSVDGHRELWESRLPPEPPVFCLVAPSSGEPRAFVAGGPSEAGGATGDVYAIYVLPAAQRTGLGRELLDAAAERLASSGCTAAQLWVLTTNAPARRFYESQGWTTDGTSRVEEIRGTSMDVTRYTRPLG